MCWGTLLSGRLIRLIRFKVAVNHGSTVVLRTTVGDERGANGAAVSGSSRAGILDIQKREVVVNVCEDEYTEGGATALVLGGQVAV